MENLGAYAAQRLLANLAFEPTPGQSRMIGELGAFLAADADREIMLIKGYAGTGKTSLLRSLVLTLEEMKLRSVLLAPTGRAAKVLASYTGRPAFTIHKKIYRQKVGRDGMGEFVLDRNLHKRAVFVVDEASMIGDRMADGRFGSGDLLGDLLQYVDGGEGCRLVLVGDTAQLPPVGLDLSPALDPERLQSYGYGVRDMEMTDVVRQSLDSGILQNATAIRALIQNGESRIPDLHVGGHPDVELVSGEDLVEVLGSAYDRYGSGDTMVVTRSNKRANRFNAGIRSQILWREAELSAGDLLMVVKNNYYWKDEEKRLDFIANGDIVKVERLVRTESLHGFTFATARVSFPDYDGMELEVKLLLDVIELESPSLSREQHMQLYASVAEDYPDAGNKSQLSLKLAADPYFNALQVKYAYAVTCHKAQGGQWKAVFFDQGYYTKDMMGLDYLRWLYTAFTRASEKLYLVNLSPEFLRTSDGSG
ncbi:MAG: AAA family ATPase [Bacteroidales bacterium]